MKPAAFLPRYGSSSLADVLPSVLGAMGVPGESDLLQLPAAPRYCVLLIDGLGAQLLRRHPVQAPFLSSLRGLGSAGSITATAPTTTATSLTSLGTGLPPGRHGVVGFTSRVPGGTELFNALAWDPPQDPEQYQPYPSVFQRAEAAGVHTRVIGKRAFRNSGLTSVALRSSGFRPAETFGERVAAAVAAFDRPGRALAYVYEGDLDYTGHVHGCGSAAWRHHLAVVDRFAEELHDALPADTVLLVTADHGMVDVAREQRIDVDDIPALRQGVALVAGEARFRHVYAEPGAAEDVCAAWASVLGTRAVVRSRAAAVQAGWFGAVEERVLERIGDVVVSVNGDCAIERRSVFPGETRLVGLHGALTETEMLVPLLVGQA